MRALLTLAILLALVSAGCVSKPPPDAVSPASASTSAKPGDAAGAAGGAPKVTSVKVSVALAEPGLVGGLPVSEPTSTEQGPFEMPADGGSVLIEAKWSCTTPTCGFALWVLSKDGKTLASSKGENGAKLAPPKLAPGSYVLALRSTGPAANMAGEIRASVFAGNATAGYSAFGGT